MMIRQLFVMCSVGSGMLTNDRRQELRQTRSRRRADDADGGADERAAVGIVPIE